MAVLLAGVADAHLRNARPLRQPLGHGHGIGATLADLQQQVLAFARRLECGQLIDLEIFRHSADGRAQHRLAKRQRQRAHSATSNTAACAAMPSSRPVKPSFSLVVALILTRSSSIPSRCATFSRIASACGPTLGRSQITVMSALPTCHPRSASNALQCVTNRLLSAPFQWSSD